jgi:DNA-binding transcriptional LysR family regulator
MNNWDDMRYFLAVAREGSISAASRVLEVNHTTVSRRIQALEERHGVRLFERNAEGYSMTQAGGEIFDLSVDLETRNLAVSRILFGQDQRLNGPINLTMPHDIFEHVLADDIGEFTRLYPEIDINLQVARGLKDLGRREADLAIRLTPNPPDYLIGQRVVDLQHAIYAPAGMDFDAGIRLVLWSDEQELPDWTKQHFPNASIALRVDDLYSMYSAVKAGIGIAHMPCYEPDSIADPGVVKLPHAVARSDWGVWVLSHVDLRKTARIQLCRKFLIDALKRKKELFQR